MTMLKQSSVMVEGFLMALIPELAEVNNLKEDSVIYSFIKPFHIFWASIFFQVRYSLKHSYIFLLFLNLFGSKRYKEIAFLTFYEIYDK